MEAALNSPLGRTVLTSTPLKIGRASDNTLVITDPQSSSHHVEIAPGFGGNGFQITDLNSTNGTFLNEERLSPQMPRPLNAGDVIRIGSTQMTYEVAGASYQPTVSAPTYEPTILAAPAIPDAYAQQGTYSPSQPPAYQPPAYQPQPNYPQPGYPQPQPGYPQPQPGYPQPQPGYQQPNFGQPAYQQPKKSRAGCWIAAVVVIVVLIGLVGGGALLLNKVAGPQKTLDAYCDGLKTGNAQELYDQLDSADQKKTSVSDIQKSLALFAVVGGIKNCTYTNVQVNGSTATATMTITPGSSLEKPTSGPVKLIQENGAWKLVDTSSSSACC